ncbi:MAG: hypothetical protein ACRDJU_10305 [Actinomycetota bacterium]
MARDRELATELAVEAVATFHAGRWPQRATSRASRTRRVGSTE